LGARGIDRTILSLVSSWGAFKRNYVNFYVYYVPMCFNGETGILNTFKSNSLSMTESEILNLLGEDHEMYMGAMSPPIIQTSNFAFKNVADLKNGIACEFERGFYTRGYNPTVAILRKKLAALEGTPDALVFSSGSAAIYAAVMSVINQGDHVICVKSPYSWTNYLLGTYVKRFGIETSFVDGTDLKNFEAEIKSNTRLIYLESPNSITFEIQDLESIARLAKLKNIVTICDNSYSTPIYQNPYKLGIDLVVHSATKYINGHSDTVAGVVCGDEARIKKMMKEEYMVIGSICSPMDAWLLLRGLRTLPVRLEKSNESAKKIVEFLSKHPAVKKVYYPFHESNPQQALAKNQMKGCGGLFSIELVTENTVKIEKFCNVLKFFRLACSWGSYESLQFPFLIFAEQKGNVKPTIKPNIIRFYIGLENADELINDFKLALKTLAD
jgi:cystathionine beta-lyase